MDWDDYFRQQAAMYMQLAEKTEDAFIKQELLDLAAVCEEVANNLERPDLGFRHAQVAFKARIRAMGIRDRPTSFRSPWQNGSLNRVDPTRVHGPFDCVQRRAPSTFLQNIRPIITKGELNRSGRTLPARAQSSATRPWAGAL
jgi:hypothetical protein